MSTVVVPDWQAPPHVRVFCTTRAGGVSSPPYDSMNLGLHVNDAIDDVRENRRLLVEQNALPAEPLWLRQIHGTRVAPSNTDDHEADGAFTDRANDVLAVMTADCLPVVLTDAEGSRIAVAHAGWRGLADGVLESAVATFTDRDELFAWLGPAIGPQAFEVGSEVREQFLDRRADLGNAFKPGISSGKYLADIYELARIELHALGHVTCSGGSWCTYSDAQRFHSYRRDGARSGRMATVAWLESSNN